jgi:methionyl aminopeptidase
MEQDHTHVRLGPNEPCWCGSGRKYKKCHMSADQTGPRAEPPRALKRGNPLLLEAEGREGMRRAGRVNAQLMDEVRKIMQPGTRTMEIDRLVAEWTQDHGHRCATLGYRGSRGAPPFPAHCCTSPNDVVCHGIPGEYVLKEGDMINVDLTTIVDGWHGDQSETFLIGEVSEEAARLTQCAFDAMWQAIDAIKPFSKVIEIGRAVQSHARRQGFSVVKEYQGHGIGRQFHQKPHVPHFPDTAHGRQVLEPGMCFTIEPMINAGGWRTRPDQRDGWTVYTADGSLSAQFEHTILMTEQGPEVLTLTTDGPRRGHRFQQLAHAR